MANRNLAPLKGLLERGVVVLAGKVNIDDDASVLSCTIKGASVAKTATGTYTITLEDKFTDLLSCNVTLESSVAVDMVPQLVSSDVSSAKTIVVKLLTDAAAADPGDVCALNVCVVLKDSSVR